MVNDNNLRKKIIDNLQSQGFKVNPHIKPYQENKETYKKLQKKARTEQILKHKKFLKLHLEKVKSFCKNGYEINPNKISLELRLIKPNSFEDILFKWWNFIWWSIPYQRVYGRTMRYLIWDITHKCPFGLFSLHSPILRMSVRDKYLEIPKNELDIWVNRSMSAQRVGALPPYNELIGGKLVALSLTSNEVRNAYKEKYENYISVIKKRKLSADLLFVTTSSAFGKSSIYNRLKYHNELVAKSLGYTKGSGSFHIPEKLYQEIIQYLQSKKENVERGYGNGPSRKLRLIALGFRYLSIPSFIYHGIKREFFLFSLVKNLKEVINIGEEPIWVDRPFNELVNFWKERWCIPRAERKPQWKNFNVNRFFNKLNYLLS